MGEEVTEQIDFKRAEFFRKQVVRGKYLRIDNSTAPPIIAPLSPCLQERCIASPGLITEVIYNRFVLHLPYYRQVEIFNSMGVNFHRKTLCDWALLGLNWLDIIYREIQKLVAIIQCDGYQVYRSRAEKRRWLKLVGCQAHMRRKFVEALDQSPELVSWILHQIALLYQIEERLRKHLTDVLTRLPAMTSSEAASLTPAAWHAARSGKA